ncbi:hypothetical protein CPB83DRAFT_850201 [Crepidotus variabilis]|uniref:Uncharacterized protein n=1 Tax=Crepidotus variabilis TaxID=179855 RepID=A0A9P6EJ97_9AGAR|nr:hypothetical protein CPB83DRAFT_850201 [Crepidotus variabilis]
MKRQVELPPDIHPLPDSVNAYFVYPFTLEPHILTLESSRRSTLAAHASRREAYLRSRDEEKERRKREALRRIAPGFEPFGGPLVPTKGSQGSVGLDHVALPTSPPKRDVMDDLVDHLAALEGPAASTGAFSRFP